MSEGDSLPPEINRAQENKFKIKCMIAEPRTHHGHLLWHLQKNHCLPCCRALLHLQACDNVLGMVILLLVGREMRNMVRIARMMFTMLVRGVNIKMIIQGTCEINISCVIEGRDTVKVLNLIHHSCLQSHELSLSLPRQELIGGEGG
jgi:aspartokinase